MIVKDRALSFAPLAIRGCTLTQELICPLDGQLSEWSGRYVGFTISTLHLPSPTHLHPSRSQPA